MLRDEGDRLSLFDAVSAAANQYSLNATTMNTVGRLFAGMTYGGIETFDLLAGTIDDVVQLDMTAGDLPDVVTVDGNTGNDGVEILAANGGDAITIANTGGTTRATVEITRVEEVDVVGGNGNDVINNQTGVTGQLEGADGDDIIVGGTSDDAFLLGGTGRDALFGLGENVTYLADHEIGPGGILQEVPEDGDLYRVGGDNSMIVSRGADLLCSLGRCFAGTVDADGATIDVCLWLLATFNSVAIGIGSAPAPPPAGGLPEGESPLQNPDNPVDVDADGSVSPLDALLVVNRLNSGDSSSGGVGEGKPAPKIYYDVTGDRVISPLDVLVVVNHLNSPDGGVLVGEGERSTASTGQTEPLVGVPEATYVQGVGANSDRPETTAFAFGIGWGKDGDVRYAPSSLAEPINSSPMSLTSRSHDEARHVLFALHASQNRVANVSDVSIRLSEGKDELDLADLALIDLESDTLDLLTAEALIPFNLRAGATPIPHRSM